MTGEGMIAGALADLPQAACLAFSALAVATGLFFAARDARRSRQSPE